MVVLDHPKDLVNIAGVIRVMMNFGIPSLRLVNPDEFDGWRIGGIAHRSEHIVEAATIHDTLADAVSDVSFIVGTTARARTAGRAYVRPREAAERVSERLKEGKVAILMGREDRGLTNEGLDLCHAVTIIPTDPDYSSLNLAQAFLVLGYEMCMAADGGEDELPVGRRATRPPTQEELETTFEVIEAGLGLIEFFKAREPAAVMRTLRTIIMRAEPDLREAKLLRGIGYEIGHFIDRSGDS
ncbi:MAG: TrmJ/YjtD family RNA methyltransferase [Proteobacteria bacterium]|nr:TrmJ/YjtD family RNA methyltransferase [Pseudomonadota bacterium]